MTDLEEGQVVADCNDITQNYDIGHGDAYYNTYNNGNIGDNDYHQQQQPNYLVYGGASSGNYYCPQPPPSNNLYTYRTRQQQQHQSHYNQQRQQRNSQRDRRTGPVFKRGYNCHRRTRRSRRYNPTCDTRDMLYRRQDHRQDRRQDRCSGRRKRSGDTNTKQVQTSQYRSGLRSPGLRKNRHNMTHAMDRRRVKAKHNRKKKPSKIQVKLKPAHLRQKSSGRWRSRRDTNVHANAHDASDEEVEEKVVPSGVIDTIPPITTILQVLTTKEQSPERQAEKTKEAYESDNGSNKYVQEEDEDDDGEEDSVEKEDDEGEEYSTEEKDDKNTSVIACISRNREEEED